MAKTGLSYYQAETDRFQDIKVKRLKKKYGCEGYAVYQYIQNEIYRVEGCYIRFTDDQLFDVSEYWAIDEERVEAIIEYCAEVELFEAMTWRMKRVLTSIDIQQRYVEICRRAKKKMLIPEDIQLIELQDTPPSTAPLPLFSGQQIETKTGETKYGTPKLLKTPDAIPQNSAEVPETPQNSAEKRHKEKERKEKSPSIPQAIPQTREEEDKASPCSSGKISAELCGNPSPDEYHRKLTHLYDVCRSMGCAADDWRQIKMLQDIALDDSPIWQLMEEVRHSGGRQSFNEHVLQSLRALVISGRLKVMQSAPDTALSGMEIRRMLAGIGVASYEIDEICKSASGKEQVLKEAINAVRRSKGKIMMPGLFIRSKLEKTEGQKRRETA